MIRPGILEELDALDQMEQDAAIADARELYGPWKSGPWNEEDVCLFISAVLDERRRDGAMEDHRADVRADLKAAGLL